MKYSTTVIACLLTLSGCDINTTLVGSYDDCLLENSKGVTAPHVLDAVKTSCKQKHPKQFDFGDIAKSANAKSWPEVVALEEYRSQPDDVKEQMKDQYFIDIINPRVHPDFISDARTQFDSYSRGIAREIKNKIAAENPSHSDPGASPSIGSPLDTNEKSAPIETPPPENGKEFTYNDSSRIAPLSIVTRDSSRSFFVKLEDWNSGKPVQGIFIRPGQRATTKVPLGEYRLKYATGTVWHGEKGLFGTETSYHQADKHFSFTRNGEKISGYTVELFLQQHGNLKTSTIDKDKW